MFRFAVPLVPASEAEVDEGGVVVDSYSVASVLFGLVL